VEILGLLGEDAVDFNHELGQRITMATCEKRASEFLLQRLSVAIQLSNASSIFGAMPDNK
jgi:hypothetical protein